MIPSSRLPKTDLPALRTYWAGLVLVVVFGCISITQLVTNYWPNYTKLAASTDFVSCQTAVIARAEGVNPYDKATFTRVALAHGYSAQPGPDSPKIVATYLYPPFAIGFFRPWLSEDIHMSVQVFLCIQLFFQALTLLLFVATCRQLSIQPALATLATALLALIYLHSPAAQDSLRLGQINPVVGFFALASVFFALRGSAWFSYASIALAASLKIVPVVLVGAFRLRWLPLVLGFGVLALVLNGADVQLLRWYATTSFVPDQTWIDFAYSLDINLGLPAVAFRYLGSALLGQFLGLGLLVTTLFIVGRWQGQVRKASNPVPLKGQKKTEVLQAAVLLLAVSLASAVFWQHHLHMAIAIYLLAEVMLWQEGPQSRNSVSVLTGASLLYLVFFPHFSFSGGKALITHMQHVADTAVLLLLWGRYMAELLKAKKQAVATNR